ncbi:protein STICHEL-like 2 [Vigna umbellata]|uniref:protein STICHEL-like 2 n=1 Tax=Vigna umbellata TaxID=87088 RepID=UPI001F5FE417|nr:protein STICHEL-like 2 [Vigna umbellata]XP_047151167.1 protein STICHEL-like 2 [Vigna umbellata]XP_047151168.1 protein STICHEL-like 2 [Vigna umbellata]XP_047151169.1 protein STICHEL-like 2 [Vigna umbellata]
MMEGQRHSVDIPISKTLVALRRVRSLRDPSTNSMSKLCYLVDNLHWENGSANDISLRFSDAAKPCDSDDNAALISRSLGFKGQKEQKDADSAFNSRLRPSGISCQSLQQDGEPVVYSKPNLQCISGNKSPSESCGSNHGGKGLDLASIVLPRNNDFKDGDSCYVATARSSQLERIDCSKSAKKSLRKNQVKPSELVGSVDGNVSPYPSGYDDFSPYSGSVGINQGMDSLDDNDNGCGISCCWSKSPRFREANLYGEIEDRPLVSHRVDESDLHAHRSMRNNGGGIGLNLETPRSLSMKFRPKTFSDLVGQDVVVRSLLGAISRGRITSFYLFYGPRGTGKTSASRIFAAALNCLSFEEQRPCGLCRECIVFFSGRSKDFKEVDSVRINRTDQVKSLVKSASTPPVSSRFKVFIIDECQLLNGETWASISNSLDNLSQHVVFVMITPDLDKLPRSVVSRAQRYHFPKVKDPDIVCRLQSICAEEGLDFEQEALDFIAAKSCGSVRDAEMMLDQMSLLGKKINISLAYELTGIVSDDELLDLLDLAFSSDTSNTVIRARELMRSRIDPLQLVSQLANLIMDILAGKCENGGSEVRSRFYRKYTSEADLQKLNNALKILSETEKQLRISKNQTTWFTVALLQLSSVDYQCVDANDTKFSLRGACNGVQNLEHFANKSYRLEVPEDHKGTLDSIWYKATEICHSSQLKTFLRKKGKLSSLHVDRSTACLAIAEIEFHHSHHVSKAEKSWKMIASSLQFILGCNVELRITYTPCASDSKYCKLKRSTFSFFTCSRRNRQQKSLSSNEQGSESDYGDCASENPMMKDKTSTSDCGMDAVTALRSYEGNLLSSGERFLNRSFQESTKTTCAEVDSSKEKGCNGAHLDPSILDSDNDHFNCFPKTLWLQKKFRSSYSSKLSFQGIQQQKDFVLSVPKCTCSGTYTYANEPCIFSGSCKNCTKAS